MALLLALFGGLGCAAKAPVPVFRGDATDRVRSLREARVILKSLKGEARVEVRRGERRFRFRADLMAERPGRLYAETSGFGLAALAVSVNDRKGLVYIHSRGEAYQGDPQEMLERLLGISQSPEEWVGLLLGDLPPYEDPILQVKETGDSTVMTLGAKNPRVILEFHRGTSWLKSFTELFPRKRTLSFGKPMQTPAGDVPSEIRIEIPGTGSVSLRFQKVIPNQGFAPGAFEIALPPSVEPRPLRGAEVLIPE